MNRWIDEGIQIVRERERERENNIMNTLSKPMRLASLQNSSALYRLDNRRAVPGLSRYHAEGCEAIRPGCASSV